MSVPTTVILTCASFETMNESNAIDEIQEWIGKYTSSRQPMEEITNDLLKQNDLLSGKIFIGVYNHFPEQEFKQFVLNIKWKAIESVMFLFKNDGDVRTRVFKLDSDDEYNES